MIAPSEAETTYLDTMPSILSFAFLRQHGSSIKKLIALTISLIILSLMSFSLTINQTWEIILMSNDF